MIGVVGSSEETSRLVDAMADLEVRAGPPGDVLAAGPDVVVAVGEPAVVELVRSDVGVPVLPVDAAPGLESVSMEEVALVLSAGQDAGFDVRERPLLEVAVHEEVVGRAVFDVMLVTSEPARISEYAVQTPDSADRFRADGVVVATPAGSRGYARAVGGPVLDGDAGGIAVVPVASFDVRSTARVASADATLSVRVERDEGGISLLVDGQERRGVPPKQPVTVRVSGSLETVVPPSG